MDTLQSMQVFVRVARRRAFSAAARDMRLSPAAVTKHVAALEARLNARLFERTTRSVSLTEAGRVYLERCLECLQALEDADAAVTELSKAPKGCLRISAPVDLGMSDVVREFMRAHPGVLVDLRLSNRPADLVEEGIDIALRVATELDGRYVARSVALVRVGLFASPDYLERRGRPRNPEELPHHAGLVFVEPRLRDEWTLERNRRRKRVKLSPALLSNSGEALVRAAVDGLGLVPAPSFMVANELKNGRLEPVLPDWEIVPSLRLFAVYPHRRFLLPKVRAFLELLRTAYSDPGADPWWPRS